MRADLLRTPARLRPARCMLLLLTTVLCGGAALAAPRIGAIDEPPDPLVGCGFRTIGEPPAGGRLVLFFNAGVGTMNVDGKTIALKVTEEQQCRADCIRPGKSGTQLFRLSGGDGVQATLWRRNHCTRDAEVCSDMFAGQGQLAVSSARGKARLRVRNEDCGY